MSAAKIIDKVGFCVLRERRVLLARSKGDALFQIPGGKVEAADADDLSALAREVQEELGVTLDRESAEFLGLFSAPAAGKPGVIVAVKLFSAAFDGTPSAQS
ncbi:NUDIX hydrolase [Aliiruegeria lutimaris]|uniref:NUDIX domain-containing protein n=1 Tax=Aliiruegeria lutimaris TaxID=571298 RepID=A0A1G8RPT5_9RHOB|nr:NUDIX domain-containing protein [Aliiruegeria lutimaris]SDJ18525.1 NUDIX domain-containing protein [Aliiruegeria lutimaris]